MKKTPSPQSVVVPVETRECVRLLVQELTPDQGQSAGRAFGLAVALQAMLAAAPAPSSLAGGEVREAVARTEDRIGSRLMKARDEAWNLVPQGQRAKWIEDNLASATVEVSYSDLRAILAALSPQSVVVPRELVNKLVQELAPDQGQSASIAFGLALELQGAIAVPPSSAALRADLNNYVTRCIRSTPEADMSLEEALIARAARALSAPAPSSLAGGELLETEGARVGIVNIIERHISGWAGEHADNPYDAAVEIGRDIFRLAALSPEAPAREVTDAMVEAACSRFVSESDDIWSASVWPEGLDDDGDRGDGGRVRLISEDDQHKIRAAMRFALQDALTPRHEAPASEGDAS